jgi:hypothetical protein
MELSSLGYVFESSLLDALELELDELEELEDSVVVVVVEVEAPLVSFPEPSTPVLGEASLVVVF